LAIILSAVTHLKQCSRSQSNGTPNEKYISETMQVREVVFTDG